MKYKNRLYRGSVAAALFAVSLVLTACGGEFVGRNDDSTEVVSKGAVSGEAVSGSAVEEEKETNGNQKWNEIQQMVADIYPYHSSRCAYVQENDNKLSQRTLEGKKLQTFSVPGLESEEDDWNIEAVTDDEILYNIGDDEGNSELWSVPLEETSGKESLVLEKAQMILGESVYVMYADSDYIACKSADSGYFEYDRRKKKRIGVDEADSGQVYDTADGFIWGNGLGTSDTILLSKRIVEEGGGYDFGDLYVHKVGSGKVKKIHDVVQDVSEGDLLNDYVYFDNRIFYCINKEVWCYDVERGEKQRLLTEDMLSSFWQGDDSDECIDAIHVDSTKFYMQAHTLDGRKVFSCPWRPGEKRECKWEKGLDSYMKRFPEDAAVTIETIQSGRCFYTVETDMDDGKPYCYDLERGTNQKVSKDDPEYCVWWFWESEN